MGGGGGKAQPVVAATPPVSPSKTEVIQAGQQERRDASKRRGMAKTLLAGETGGYMAEQGAGPKSLLGQ